MEFTRTVNADSPAFNPRTGKLHIKGDDVLIARDSDFLDFMEEAAPNQVFGLKTALEKEVRHFGECRSAAGDLMRMRLRQLRSFIAAH